VARLRPEYPNDHYHNDFSRWSDIHLHDPVLAERLDIIDPTEFKDIESLRERVADVVDERLGEREFIPWSTRDESFKFIRALLVIFSTPVSLNEPRDLIPVLEEMGENSLFYHFIDARRRTAEGYDDFSEWMEGFNGEYRELVEEFRKINPYFITLQDLKRQLIEICKKHLEEGVRA
jgi:hypothetical protein